MALALTLGQRCQGQTWPNPAVGCVIVNDGRIVGRGWTQAGGRPHAEVVALAQAGGGAAGATAYVTLEPCSHHGKTGPCAQALIDAKIKRCVVACQDIDPRVAGNGVRMLREAGVKVSVGVQEQSAANAHRGFFSRISLGRPRVTLKLALSLDGRIATRTGHSQWITGPAARRHVHMMRMTHDAVMVGGGTARDDDPTLSVRDFGVDRQPVRIVVSTNANFEGRNLHQTQADAPIWICHAEGSAVGSDWGSVATMIPVTENSEGQVDAAHMLQALGDRGLTSVLCEGGGKLAASLLSAGLVDDLVVFSAGMVIGGDGRAAVAALGIDQLGEVEGFAPVTSRFVGTDIMHHWRKV